MKVTLVDSSKPKMGQVYEIMGGVYMVAYGGSSNITMLNLRDGTLLYPPLPIKNVYDIQENGWGQITLYSPHKYLGRLLFDGK